MRRDKGLEDAYQLIIESEHKGTVDTGAEMPKPGQGFDNDKSQAKGMGGDSPAAKSVDSPEEMDEDLSPGHGTIAEEKEIKDMMPESKFDSLFKATLVSEEFGDEENPLEQTGEGEFDDEMGDFPSADEDTVDDEVDVATELRMVIDRLNDIAEKIGAFDEGDDMGGDEMGDEFTDEDDFAMGEAVTTGGPGKGAADGKLKSYPDTTKKMTSKSSQKVSGTSNMQKQTAAGHGKAGGPGAKKADGKLGKFPDAKDKMQQKSNMVVKGKVGTAGKSIFDAS